MRNHLRRNIKFLGLLTILTLTSLSSQALQCIDLFVVNRDLPSEKMVASVTENIKVPLYPHITEGNVQQLFTHNYTASDLGKFGAKAVVAMLPNEMPQVYFFPTGSGLKEWKIQHLDAILVLLNDPEGRRFFQAQPYIQGYELTAERRDGRLVVTIVAIDSQITKSQARNEYWPTLEHENAMLNALVLNIDEPIRQFSMPNTNLH